MAFSLKMLEKILPQKCSILENGQRQPMQKEFNITGTCIPDRHFMVDIHHRLLKIQTMIEKGQYFVMNRPRQFGKTTTLFLLKNFLIGKYVVLSLSFEGTGDEIFDSEKLFANSFVDLMKKVSSFRNRILR